MPFRRLLLRILFISLAAAAIFGAAGVLFASSDGIGRIVTTCIATASAALLLLATGLLAKREKASALAAAAMTIAEYLLALMLIWELYDSSSDADEGLFFTMFFLAACGIPAIVLIHLRDIRITRFAARVGLILCALTFAFCMFDVWLLERLVPEQFANHDTFSTLTSSFAGFGVLAVLCLIGAGLDRRRWRWIGVATSALAFAILVYASFSSIQHGSAPFVIIIVIACLIAHANVITLIPLKPNQLPLRWITLAAALATGVGISVCSIVYDYADPAYQLSQRLASAAAIIAGCGTIALLVLARINRKLDTPTPALADITDIALTCPFCNTRQTLPTGDSRCPACGLLLHIQISEPRCPACNYSLLLLNSDRCPECGTPIVATATTVVIPSPTAPPLIPSPGTPAEG